MENQSDFKELLALLNANHVDYIIVGGYALAYYGLPRFTGDLDLLVKPDTDNARGIIDALSEFGFSSLGLTEDDFIQPEQVVQLGRPPVRVEALDGRIEGRYGDMPVNYLGRDQFIANKLATGRTRDLADVELLSEMIEAEDT